ncbi:hypothetical protein HN51_041297 [Arachis hypogaea]|nr:UPF0496 protein At3g19330 isoform X1 [Arachis ipaensis]XP_016162078.1 UPF0496 protein At3g19330 isoform X1 [Arachis ipaensis]XP_025658602.1 UPF0496 protein At3g19330 [Arachis hypogaea]QHN87035.1 UPF0496 protein [Arachis hypogaea]
MLQWLSSKSLPPHASTSVPTLPLSPAPAPAPPHSQGNSTENSSTASSPGPNIARAYDDAVQANSYNEIRSVIQAPLQDHLHLHQQIHEVEVIDEEDKEDSHHRHVLAHALRPDRQSIREALANAESCRGAATLTRLASDYFDHSEKTCGIYLLLHRSVRRARDIYKPLHELIAVLPDDASGSFNRHLCDRAFDLFVQFDSQENPFVFPHNFSDVRDSLSGLKLEIERRRLRCYARIRLLKRFHTSCLACLVVTAVGAVISAVLVTAHAVAGFAAVAACGGSCLPKKKVKKELTRLNQLNAASKGTLVMNDIDTVNSLVDRLQTAVEGDRVLIQFALNRGRERHPIQEVLKQLRKNQQSFEPLLAELEVQIYLCFNAVNKARMLLLQEICLYPNL